MVRVEGRQGDHSSAGPGQGPRGKTEEEDERLAAEN